MLALESSAIMLALESSASCNLARPTPLPPPRTLKRRQEMAVDFALGDWEPFDRPACAREERLSSPAAKRLRTGPPSAVEEEPPPAVEALAVATFLGAPDAAWNWLPGGNHGATWQQAQAAGARLGLGSHKAARPPLREPVLESARAGAAEDSAGDAKGDNHTPALVSFEDRFAATIARPK
jgi:hypothetical protein